MRNVLSVASEIYPLIKTGGLADVAGAIPGALAERGVRMRSLVPGYPQVLGAIEDWETFISIDDFFGRPARILSGTHADSGLDLLAIDAPGLYDREGNPYVDTSGRDWADNHTRFAGLAFAAGLCAGGDDRWCPDIIHGHDWQAGLTPLYLRKYGLDRTAFVFTIHNIAFQGVFAPTLMDEIGLPSAHFQVDGYEYHGQIGMLKAGIFYADKVTTVSPTYAREIRTAGFGMGLEGLLAARAADLSGVVNGIDTEVWNPASDTTLPALYSSKELNRRSVNKQAVQRRFGLSPEPDRPLFCIVSRLTYQKGMDLVLATLGDLVASGGQLALIGTGEPSLEQAFIVATQQYQGSVGCIIGYDESVAHLLQGGSDAILVPSRFEPCGLTQLYGLRYGCVPVVARVGGLADTIIDANDAALQDGVATGIELSAVDAPSLRMAIERAADLYRNQPVWQAIQRRGMSRELGWKRAAGRYAEIYEEALQGRVRQ